MVHRARQIKVLGAAAATCDVSTVEGPPCKSIGGSAHATSSLIDGREAVRPLFLQYDVRVSQLKKKDRSQ